MIALIWASRKRWIDKERRLRGRLWCLWALTWQLIAVYNYSASEPGTPSCGLVRHCIHRVHILTYMQTNMDKHKMKINFYVDKEITTHGAEPEQELIGVWMLFICLFVCLTCLLICLLCFPETASNYITQGGPQTHRLLTSAWRCWDCKIVPP